MSQSNSETNWLIFFIAVGLITVFLFARSLGVDFSTGARVLGWGGLAVGISGGMWYMNVRRALVITVLFAGLWFALWPALGYWAQSDFERSLGHSVSDLPWWATSYAKAGGLVVIAAIGYAFASLFDER